MKTKTLDQIIKDLEKTVADINRIVANGKNYIKNPILKKVSMTKIKPLKLPIDKNDLNTKVKKIYAISEKETIESFKNPIKK